MFFATELRRDGKNFRARRALKDIAKMFFFVDLLRSLGRDFGLEIREAACKEAREIFIKRKIVAVRNAMRRRRSGGQEDFARAMDMSVCVDLGRSTHASCESERCVF